MTTVDQNLIRLARLHGVGTTYRDWRRRQVDVRPQAIANVLAAMGVDTSTSASMRRQVTAARRAMRHRDLPATVVLRTGQRRRLPRPATLVTEQGTELHLRDQIPGDLPIGWHQLHMGERTVTVVVAPRTLPAPHRAWGWMLQLYAVRSADSWGMGDLGDLVTFLRWAGGTGADAVLLNPMHIVDLTHPIPASPYAPSSRRWTNPLYLRIADLPEYREAGQRLRAEIDGYRPAGVPTAADQPRQDPSLIDYDAVWRAKRAAMHRLSGRRLDELAAAVTAGEIPEVDLRLATYFAIAEVHGPNWRDWPADLRDHRGPQVAALAAGLTDRIASHLLAQQATEAQAAEAQRAATGAGMAIGVLKDLAVGVDPAGADGWTIGDVLADGVSIGAPPDAFNQLGQNWGLAPMRPDRLVATGYAAYRDLLRASLRNAGGVRIDHILGLWRLWWVPAGSPASMGAYVHYDAEAMLAILALEATRAGAVVVGEDLGTVEPRVTRTLRERNVLGSSVLWFMRDQHREFAPFLPARQWPVMAAASVSTHDLPTATGFLEFEHVRVRAELGQLGREVAVEQAEAERGRALLLERLCADGLLTGTGPWSTEEIVLAMHAMLAAAPSRLALLSPYDLLGERRQPNLPGTVDQYPNWRMPLPKDLAGLFADPLVGAAVELMRRRS